MATYTLTIRLSKNLMGAVFSKRANKAVSAIKKNIVSQFKVDEVKIDNELNAQVWSQGRRNPPRKVRVTVEVEEKDGKKVAVVTHAPVASFANLLTVVTKDEE